MSHGRRQAACSFAAGVCLLLLACGLAVPAGAQAAPSEAA